MLPYRGGTIRLYHDGRVNRVPKLTWRTLDIFSLSRCENISQKEYFTKQSILIFLKRVANEGREWRKSWENRMNAILLLLRRSGGCIWRITRSAANQSAAKASKFFGNLCTTKGHLICLFVRIWQTMLKEKFLGILLPAQHLIFSPFFRHEKYFSFSTCDWSQKSSKG